MVPQAGYPSFVPSMSVLCVLKAGGANMVRMRTGLINAGDGRPSPGLSSEQVRVATSEPMTAPSRAGQKCSGHGSPVRGSCLSPLLHMCVQAVGVAQSYLNGKISFSSRSASVRDHVNDDDMDDLTEFSEPSKKRLRTSHAVSADLVPGMLRACTGQD